MFLFLEREMPDIFCAQELLQKDIPLLEKTLGAHSVFAPMCYRTIDGDVMVQGVGIFSRLPMKNVVRDYYLGTKEGIGLVDSIRFNTHNADDLARLHETLAHVLLRCDVEKDGEQFRISTTHFTWTPDGEANDFQRGDCAKMLGLLEKAGDIVFCGDLNAPRGGEIFKKLSEHFTDNVPPQYNSSLDKELHRVKNLEHMVDCMFSTDGYVVSDVKMLSGLSDHCALTATIAKK